MVRALQVLEHGDTHLNHDASPNGCEKSFQNGLSSRIPPTWFMVQGLWFMVQGSWFKINGSWLRPYSFPP